MKICFIGNCGHAVQAFRELQQLSEVQFCGFAPGSPEEEISPFWREHMPIYPSYPEMLECVSPELVIVSPHEALTYLPKSLLPHRWRSLIGCGRL